LYFIILSILTYHIFGDFAHKPEGLLYISTISAMQLKELFLMCLTSAGGSAVASDTIYREVLKLTKSGKPVIVSMGNVAASGGYYISAPATKIVAQPSTVTGSIGVVSSIP